MLNIILLMYGLKLSTVLWENSENIETGRYINVPLNEWLCTQGDEHQVEYEFDALLIYDLDNDMFEYCHKIRPMLQHMSLEDGFVFIMWHDKLRQPVTISLNRQSFIYAH